MNFIIVAFMAFEEKNLIFDVRGKFLQMNSLKFQKYF